jgi:integration host factor subunit alpha
MSITKADIIDDLSKTVGLSKTDATEMVEKFFDSISKELIEGHDVKISGFGGFNLRDKESRPGRNPKTKEPAVIEARRVVTFKPSPIVKGALGGLDPRCVEFSARRQSASALEDSDL